MLLFVWGQHPWFVDWLGFDFLKMNFLSGISRARSAPRGSTPRWIIIIIIIIVILINIMITLIIISPQPPEERATRLDSLNPKP